MTNANNYSIDIKTLSHEEIKEIFTEYNSDISEERKTEIEEYIIDKNVKLISALIKKYFRSYASNPYYMDELMQAGRIGIFNGMKTYNPDKGKFSTFFATYINGQIRATISEWNGTTSHYNAQKNIIDKANTSIQEESGKNEPLSPIAIKHKTGIQPKTIVQTLNAIELSESIHIEENNSHAVEALATTTIEEDVENKIREEIVAAALDKLPILHRLVIHYSFGFDNGKCYGDTATASLLTQKGYSCDPNKVKQIKQEALRFLSADPAIERERDNYHSFSTRSEEINNTSAFDVFEERVLMEEERKLDVIDPEDCNIDTSYEEASFESFINIIDNCSAMKEII